MRSPGGRELSLSACPGVGNRPPSKKKIANPRGCARGGMVTGRIEPCITRLCFRTRQALRREEKKAMKSFEGSFRNLNFSPSTSILLNFSFPFIDIRCFFLSSTSVLSYNRFAKEA